ncbi:MAG: DUF4349 domain-containing protein [Lachnospiraceae bacterium]
MRGQKKKAILFGVITALVLAGCGSSNKSAASYDSYSYAVEPQSGGTGIYYADSATEELYTEAGESYQEQNGTSAENVRAGRKLIRTVNLDVETLEFDNLLSYVKNRTSELGGYVESMNAYNGSSYYTSSYSGSGYRNNRSASMTLRIPKDRLDEFLTQVEENSNITNRSEQERDVTLDYVDLDSHKAVLLAEQERLIALMEQAESIEDIITLESRLSDIRYQIESMESQLRTYDNQIEYSTVYLSITEVVELTPVETVEKTTWERISDGFMHSMRNIGNGIKEFFIGFVIAIPYLVLIAVIVLVIVWIILFSIKRSTAKKNKKMEELRQKQQAEYMRQMQQAGYAGQTAQVQQSAQQNRQQ